MSGFAAQVVPFAAAMCVGAGAWLLVDGGGSRRRRARLLSADGVALGPRQARLRRPARLPERGAVRTVLGCLAAGAVVSLWGASPLPLLAAALLAPLAVRRWRGRRERQAADRRQEAVIELCGSVAGEVRAGRPPGQALVAVGQERLGKSGAGVLAAARYGGDVPAALRAAAGQPGADGLRGVAACWQVAVDGGASLASGLERVAQTLRAERDQREELRAQLAGPRSTALLLAVLPLAGLLLGSAMGVQPMRELLHSPPGLVCLLIGASLEWAGLAWAARITRVAERGAR
jgi:tight adherence protein B